MATLSLGSERVKQGELLHSLSSALRTVRAFGYVEVSNDRHEYTQSVCSTRTLRGRNPEKRLNGMGCVYFLIRVVEKIGEGGAQSGTRQNTAEDDFTCPDGGPVVLRRV